MVNILLVTDDLNNAGNYYRGSFQLSELKRLDPSINIMMLGTVYYHTMDIADILMIVRPHSQEHLDLCTMAHSMGTKIWLDFDDLVYDIPISNPCYDEYRGVTKDRINAMAMMADKITVSTYGIYGMFEGMGKKVVVIQNTNKNLVQNKKQRYQNEILWRGTETHDEDLRVYADQIVQLSKELDIPILFLGYKPHFLSKRVNYNHIGDMDLYRYFNFMSMNRFKMLIVPLEDNDFNHAKSNIAALEASLTGTPCLAPDWAEWKWCDYRYNTKEDFVFKGLDIANVSDIPIEYMQITANRKRLEVIQELCR